MPQTAHTLHTFFTTSPGVFTDLNFEAHAGVSNKLHNLSAFYTMHLIVFMYILTLLQLASLLYKFIENGVSSQVCTRNLCQAQIITSFLCY